MCGEWSNPRRKPFQTGLAWRLPAALNGSKIAIGGDPSEDCPPGELALSWE